MYVVGLDDTDSRESGMCTTYAGTVLAERLRDAGYDVRRQLLVRCNPAIEHKTRGNAAVALHVERSEARVDGDVARDDGDVARVDGDVARVDGDVARGDGDVARGDGADEPLDDLEARARTAVDELAATEDPETNPGVVVGRSLDALEEPVATDLVEFSRAAVRDRHEIDDAVALAERAGFRTAAWGNGRGRIGALAAVGAWGAREEWTYERIAYREPERWGTERDVDESSVREVADEHYPTVWDTVDRVAGEVVCVPHTPGPVLYGVRGDEPDAVERAAAAIDGEPVARAATFVTNQGTDAHVQRAPEGAPTDRPLPDGAAFRVDGVVASEPETRRGGHVFVDLRSASEEADESTVECVAFEPTKRFRDRVRALRAGDAVTVVGEVSDGTLKLEKFALRDPVRTESVTPECPDCGRTMESAGANAGYRCRDCGTSTDGPATRHLERDIDVGWYEVPPRARRHVAKPLVRGGFDAPVHTER